MQTLRIKKQIDSEILYVPEFKNMIGKNVEIIILAEPEKTSEEKDRQLLETINAAYNDNIQDTEEQMIRRNMRRCHRRLISEDGKW